MNEEWEEALLFFSLDPQFSKEDMTSRFRDLANRYHPDKGEFTSDVMFVKLLHYKNILESHLGDIRIKTSGSNPGESRDTVIQRNDYSLYREAKKLENEAIYRYYKLRKKHSTVELDENKNLELHKLREQLEIVRTKYEEFLIQYPDSIWVGDVKDSLDNISVWWK
ncbi:MAG: molecular chaperone DnaJ [Leptospiraceae bacterium]|nr:molecular chaperone DnaJ [Leptospiraceae bacterium]MCP5513226.1 molecular chaperone DnaJ [Leptospiraceae bacterium]